MTLKDLGKVYQSTVKVTCLAFFEDGTYYSFRTYNTDPVRIESIDDPDILSMEILSIVRGPQALWVDIKEVIKRDSTHSSTSC